MISLSAVITTIQRPDGQRWSGVVRERMREGGQEKKSPSENLIRVEACSARSQKRVGWRQAGSGRGHAATYQTTRCSPIAVTEEGLQMS